MHCCTEALRREIRRSRIKKDALLKAERALDFPKVEELFRIIDSSTLTAVVDEKLKDTIESGRRILQSGGSEWKRTDLRVASQGVGGS